MYAAACAIGDPKWRGLVGAFRLVVLTACRTSEVLGAKWDEIDLDAEIWTIPAERMKTGIPHRVPLNDEAMDILEAARERTGGTGFVFRSPTRKAIGTDGLRRVMKRIGVEATVHGFRSSFRDWAAAQDVPDRVAEFSIAHRKMTDTKGSYFRTDLLDKRRGVMERWSRHVTGSEVSKVVSISGEAVA